MKRILIIPVLGEIETSLEIADKYSTGFEFNDFYYPDVLDSGERMNEIIARYGEYSLPALRTSHGDFFDVSVFSIDERIRVISDIRVRQSIEAARRVGASAVVFHTNYNPFLNTGDYVSKWVDINAEYWSGILEEYRGMNIYIENMFDSSPYVLAELSSRLCGYGNYGVCFDYSHSALTRVPQETWAETLGRYIRHVHISDNDLISDSHLALGCGKIDLSEFYRLYDKYMNGATVLAEVSGTEKQIISLDRLKADRFTD